MLSDWCFIAVRMFVGMLGLPAYNYYPLICELAILYCVALAVAPHAAGGVRMGF